jgi:hypothetical protein
MASPTTFGASIVPTTIQTDNPRPSATLDSPALTPAASHDDIANEYSEQRRVPPHSPFYNHPPSSDNPIDSNSRTHVAANEKDLEAGAATSLAEQPFTSKVSIDCNKECKMWPSKQTLIQTRKAEKRKKRESKIFGGCGPMIEWWGKHSKRQKLIMKLLLALFMVGVVVAIAVGITVAVNGTVYVSEGHQAAIPDPSDAQDR